MNENIDLTKILKCCPKGTKFYSSIYGDLLYSRMYLRLAFQKIIFIVPNTISSVDYYRDGKYCQGQGECTIFPSRGQRDWSKFTAPWLKKEKFDPNTLKAFDRVLVRLDNLCQWRCSLFSNAYKYNGIHYLCTSGNTYKQCIPYNDDTKHLVGTTDEAPEFYKYWEE